MLGTFLLRVEAVNLGATLFDTDELSVIRGGGVANLLAPKRILEALGQEFGNLKPIFSGASQAEALLETTDPKITQDSIEARLAALAEGRKPVPDMDSALTAALPHLIILGAAVPVDGDAKDSYLKAHRHALGRIRAMQLSRLTLDRGPRPSPDARRPCMIDGIRPARDKLYKGGQTLAVSPSVQARQELGRTLRQTIYKETGTKDRGDLVYAESFADLVEDPPSGLPPSLSGKMAVIYMDGNKFTKIRNDAIKKKPKNGEEAAATFSEDVQKARATFLDGLLDKLIDDKRMYREERLRFELLMWGGDEARFVLPAWKLRDALGHFAEDMDGSHWATDGTPLTNATGILVCHHKMPIATASVLVEEISDGAKQLEGGPQNALSIQLLESIEAPAGGIAPFRKKLYGAAQPADFCVANGDGLRRFLDAFDGVTDPHEGLPKNQLYPLIAAARSGDTQMEKSIEKAVKRSRGDDADNAAGLIEDIHNLTGGGSVVGLARLAELWEVMRPFAESAADETKDRAA